MVDEPRLRRLLQRITDDLGYLGARAAEDRGALAADEQRLAGLKYRFVTLVEGIINVAQHMCASEGWGPPSDNGDAVRVLARRGVLEPALGQQLASAVGFRNLLVHNYAEIDDARVLAMLDRLDDVRGFVTSVSSWLLAQH